MENKVVSPWRHLNKQNIKDLICFYDPERNAYLNNLQTDGCYSLWNTLCDDNLRFAYLADEVGMGKTYQALGVVGLLHYMKPDTKVVILCPGHEMQKQWSADWHGFFKEKYCPDGMDGGLKSLRIDANGTQSFESAVQPLLCDNLSQFAASLITAQHSAYLLRYTSFSLPIRVFDWDCFREDRMAKVGVVRLEQEFRQCMEALAYTVGDELLLKISPNRQERLDLNQASERFLGIYANCIAGLVNSFAPDLVIWDEAQYLRTDASRNNCMRTIFRELHQAGTRHLFLSATPAHRDVSDIEQLNHLLVDAARPAGSSLIEIKQERNDTEAFRRSVANWMVRRERSFAKKGKMAYRNFQEEPVDLFAENQSPLYALTFAAMQKNLVQLLAGQNNCFRMGELSCHESSRASIEGSLRGAARLAGAINCAEEVAVLEESAVRKQSEPVDEKYLQGIGARFRALQKLGPREIVRELPHAKVDHVVESLAHMCFENGSMEKELVFVRRVATVDELADGLLREFQNILDRRIEAFELNPDTYWAMAAEGEDDVAEEDALDEMGDQSEFFGAVEALPYFKALSAVKGNLGRLTQYRNTLGKQDTSAIRFLLVEEQAMREEEKALWLKLLHVLDVDETGKLYQPFKDDSNKALLLRRCLAHSIRFTDILVDLDVLRRKSRSGYVKQWLDMLENPPEKLAQYFTNTRIKLFGWFEHFDTIVNKCFKGGGPHNSYQDIAQRVSGYFRGLSPVARRSGRRKDENAVIQFKFPISPNVLVCTDVLREGVNLHLFCDRVSHYGISWNSGDLEQRIGRVERADSLFERRILKDSGYQLRVGFPYLAKTLDERQVKKAIRKKQEIDSLFTIIPPKETGECDDSRELVSTRLAIESSLGELRPIKDSWEQHKDEKAGDWKRTNQQKLSQWSLALQEAHQLVSKFNGLDLQGFSFTSCRILGAFDLLVVEWEKLSGRNRPSEWNVCDRHISGVFERKTQWKTIRSLYVPLGQKLTQQIIEVFWQNAGAGMSASLLDSQHEGFYYCGARRTHIREHLLLHPVTQAELRRQISYRCHWGKGYAMASNIVVLDDDTALAQEPEKWASEINKFLPLGNATLQDGKLLLVFPQVPGVMWDAKLNGRLADRLALWADRHQWALMKGGDDEQFHVLAVAGVAEMNTSEALAVIRSLRSWCEDICKDFDAEFGSPLNWKYLSFNQVIKNGVISCASEIQLIPKVGKFQIAFSLTKLDDKPEEKQVIFYLSAKLANERVVQGDMPDSWDFLSKNGEYERWLGEEYDVLVEEPCFHYAFSKYRDGKQIRRLRLTFDVSEMERQGGRNERLAYVAKLAGNQLLNDVFQYKKLLRILLVLT